MIMYVMYFRKYKSDIEGYISKMIMRESPVSAVDTNRSNIPRLPWRV